MSDIRGFDTTGMKAGVYITEAQNLNIKLLIAYCNIVHAHDKLLAVSKNQILLLRSIRSEVYGSEGICLRGLYCCFR